LCGDGQGALDGSSGSNELKTESFEVERRQERDFIESGNDGNPVRGEKGSERKSGPRPPPVYLASHNCPLILGLSYLAHPKRPR
jgi:hypothetical protein